MLALILAAASIVALSLAGMLTGAISANQAASLFTVATSLCALSIACDAIRRSK